jgi:membrane protein DedA with SNARE-associated domain
VLAFLAPFVTDLVTHYGYLGIFVLMLLGSACIPVPSEIVMAFGGALASETFAGQVLGDPAKSLSLLGVIVVGVLGSLAGSLLAYWLGYAGGRPLVDRWGKSLHLRQEEIDRAHGWFDRHGEAAVFWSRLIPLARAFISLPAGVARMNLGAFTLYTTLGLLPWTIGLALAGRSLGDRWNDVERYAGPVTIALLIAAAAFVVWWIMRRRRQASVETR